jgi:hypothetical protein
VRHHHKAGQVPQGNAPNEDFPASKHEAAQRIRALKEAVKLEEEPWCELWFLWMERVV